MAHTSNLFCAKLVLPNLEVSCGYCSWSDTLHNINVELSRITPDDLNPTVFAAIAEMLHNLPEGTDFQLSIGKIEIAIQPYEEN